jgi:hypothetical protein
MKQIEISYQPTFPCALLEITIEQLEGHGIQMFEPVEDGTWDEAGPIEAAFVQLASGQEVLLIAYLQAPHIAAPEAGIEVRAPEGVDCRGIAEALADELAVPHDRITWVRPPGWPASIDGATQ